MRQILKVIPFVLLFLLPIGAWASGAENRRLGIGVHLGEPMGYSARFFFFDQIALDVTAGYGFGEESFVVQPSLLFYMRRLLDFDGRDFSIVPHFGTGLKTGVDLAGKNDGDLVVAMRFPIGVNWVLKDGSFEISVEVGPGVEFTPATEFDPTGGIGLRYYFF